MHPTLRRWAPRRNSWPNGVRLWEGETSMAFVDATLRMAGVKSSPAAAQKPPSVDELLGEGKARSVEKLDRSKMNDEIRRLVNWISHIVYFSEKRITDQLVPADSQ